jgi:hypothetical protein
MVNFLAGYQVAVLPGQELEFQIIFFHDGEKMILETDVLDATLGERLQQFIGECYGTV